MAQENHDLSAQPNTRECAVGAEVEAQKRPKIFSAGLSDDELIEFLRDLIKTLEARKYFNDRPKELRASADAAEKELTRLNTLINVSVDQHS
ncbi:hypothetical protein WCT97_16520 [Pectobacterium versatile]|uniref:hypothetical protein n=1 Tax=Pectobacterium versatile TaxID=2488639 RepID=UPI00301B3DA3